MRMYLSLSCTTIIKYSLDLPSFRSRKGLHPRPKNRNGWDTLEKAMTVLKLDPKNGLHRRVDLIYAPRDVYWCAIVGWLVLLFRFLLDLIEVRCRTGSTQFERDIRLWARKKMCFHLFLLMYCLFNCRYRGMKFDSSGITRLRDTKQI